MNMYEDLELRSPVTLPSHILDGLRTSKFTVVPELAGDCLVAFSIVPAMVDPVSQELLIGTRAEAVTGLVESPQETVKLHRLGATGPPAEVPLYPPGTRKYIDLCPECGIHAVAREEGCKKCYACGWSEC
jgi:hypothetical protein